MKHLIGILLFVAILSGLSSCYNTSIDKPAKLIKKDKFVKMMVDIYLVEGVNVEQKVDSLKKKTYSNRFVLFCFEKIRCA